MFYLNCMNRIIFFSLFSFLFMPALRCQEKKNEKTDYLLMITDTVNDRYGYINRQGDTIIAPGKYAYCFTDTFRIYAIILQNNGFYAIDRNENRLYQVFAFDNGPDYVEDG